jgi:hypothetical protein
MEHVREGFDLRKGRKREQREGMCRRKPEGVDGDSAERVKLNTRERDCVVIPKEGRERGERMIKYR